MYIATYHLSWHEIAGLGRASHSCSLQKGIFTLKLDMSLYREVPLFTCAAFPKNSFKG